MGNADFVPLIFLVLGLALAVGGIYWFQRTRDFVARAMRTVGTIVSVEERTSSDSDGNRNVRTWAPVIRFKDAVGREITFTSGFSSTGMQRRVGESVPVLYEPDNSAAAQMGGGAPLYMGPVILLVIGLAFAVFGGAFVLGSTRALQNPLSFLSSSGLRGDVGRLAGEWTNVDSRTSNITRVSITKDGVRMWGRCHPVDCAWGAPASYGNVDGANGSMAVTWDHKFARRSQQLALLPDGRLQVTTQTHFVDRSGRQDRDMTDYFARAK